MLKTTTGGLELHFAERIGLSTQGVLPILERVWCLTSAKLLVLCELLTKWVGGIQYGLHLEMSYLLSLLAKLGGGMVNDD